MARLWIGILLAAASIARALETAHVGFTTTLGGIVALGLLATVVADRLWFERKPTP
ncbi:MAG TPA: hypothetical protein VKT70_15705 [Stellaceae bacterium]|nr:hypothetical protein [Stellaceae bacterium]